MSGSSIHKGGNKGKGTKGRGGKTAANSPLYNNKSSQGGVGADKSVPNNKGKGVSRPGNTRAKSSSRGEGVKGESKGALHCPSKNGGNYRGPGRNVEHGGWGEGEEGAGEGAT